MSKIPMRLAAIAACVLAVAHPARAANDWSPRGVFAFGGVVFDFERKAFRADFEQGPLVDCSTADVYCARSSLLALALPKACGRMDDGVWAIGDVHTRVLWKGPPPGGGDPRIAPPVYLLGDETRPNIVYRYTERMGVRAIYYDRQNQMRLTDMAKADGLKDLDQKMLTDPLLGYRLYRGIVTLDMFGNCHDA
jgi:hypothetical protein